MHENTKKVDGGHAVRSKGVRCDGIHYILKGSSKNEEYRNEESLNEYSRLEEESTEERVCQTKRVGDIPVLYCDVKI